MEGDAEGTHDTLTSLVRLMPNLHCLHLRCNDGVVHTLAPLLQLPELAHLTIDTNRNHCDLSAHAATLSLAQMLGTTPPKCQLKILRLNGSERFHELLVESDNTGLHCLAAPSAKQLMLYNMEHRAHFASHLAHFQNVKTLTLLSPARQLNVASGHRQQLIIALQQLPRLITLRLYVERKKHLYHSMHHTTPDRTVSQPWSAEELTALFQLPLQELAVQHLEPTAGEALLVLAGGPRRKLRILKLGETQLLNWDVVQCVARRLKQLVIPASSKPASIEKRRADAESLLLTGRHIPESITFYDKWSQVGKLRW